jgi:hypothetical protein
MKKIKLFFLVLSALLLAGCSNDNDSGGQTDDPMIADTWKLLAVHGGIGGIIHEFPENSVTFDFNTTAHTVAVVNNSPDGTSYGVPATGTYDYEYVTNTSTPELCAETIIIGTDDYGCAFVEGDALSLTQQYADGYAYEFSR